jgi:hypothetical protein
MTHEMTLAGMMDVAQGLDIAAMRMLAGNSSSAWMTAEAAALVRWVATGVDMRVVARPD